MMHLIKFERHIDIEEELFSRQLELTNYFNSFIFDSIFFSCTLYVIHQEILSALCLKYVQNPFTSRHRHS